MLKFKVGDIVRVVKIDEDESIVGCEFPVKFIEEGFEFPYILDVYGTEVYFSEDELELVQTIDNTP